MCGIVGAVAERNVVEILLEGLKRLEYRGYDSAGVALLTQEGDLRRLRRVGKVQELADAVTPDNSIGSTGIAHTRWATHAAVLPKIMPTRTRLLNALRSYTTASLKTISSFAKSSPIKVIPLAVILTLKLLHTPLMKYSSRLLAC